MRQQNNAKKNSQRKPEVKNKNEINNKCSGWKKRLGSSTIVLLFLFLWVFFSWIYGSVFYICEQNSFFAFNSLLMKNISSMEWGYFILLGRFLLLSFHFPLIGGFILSSILVFFVLLSCYLCGNHKRLYFIPLLLVFAFIFFLLNSGYNLFYQRESSIVFIIPVVGLFVVSIFALLKRVLTRTKFKDWYKSEKASALRNNWITSIFIILCLGALSTYALTINQNIRATCKMQVLLEDDDYESMIEIAHSVRHPNRGVAAYHAIALQQTGQLLDHEFDIPYQYPIENVKNRTNKNDDAITLYSIDGNFFAGLSMTSYHDAMERFVVDGPTIFMLKRLCRAALANHEWNLARKYVYILSYVPFETKTVERFQHLIANPSALAQDATFMKINDLFPMEDSFEQEYQTPLFLGYNVAAGSFRSLEALKASIGACLYTKKMPEFIDRVMVLNGQSLPVCVEQALALQSYSQPDLRKMFPIEQGYAFKQVVAFAQSACLYLNKREEGAKVLKDEWLQFYPYYYYFENLPPKKKVEYHQLKKEGVN